jgi:hypothetical protein
MKMYISQKPAHTSILSSFIHNSENLEGLGMELSGTVLPSHACGLEFDSQHCENKNPEANHMSISRGTEVSCTPIPASTARKGNKMGPGQQCIGVSETFAKGKKPDTTHSVSQSLLEPNSRTA